MIRRPVIHTMGRRCRNWDYCCDAVYMITLMLAYAVLLILVMLLSNNPLLKALWSRLFSRNREADGKEIRA